MDDKHMGGLLAFVLAAPVVVICCGGGGVILAAILGGIGGWLSGLGGIALGLTTFGVVLIVREIRRKRSENADGLQQESCRMSGSEFTAESGQ
jgi:membrane protein implicated in regulation of membrane protease activity